MPTQAQTMACNSSARAFMSTPPASDDGTGSADATCAASRSRASTLLAYGSTTC